LANKFSVCSNHPSGSARILEKSAAFGEVPSVEVGPSSVDLSEGGGEADVVEEGTTALVADSKWGEQGVVSEAFVGEELFPSSLT